MKKTMAALALLAALGANAQSEKYVAAMEKNLAMFDSAKTTTEYQALAAAFERIGDAEKTEWLPYYYAGLALTSPAWEDKKLDRDVNAERIKALCDKADALARDNADKSEILAIRNIAAIQQMLVDPPTRWTVYGQEAGNYLQQAKLLNANNPRLYYLDGANIFGTPEQFGGGKANAKPILEKAVALYKAEQQKPLYPHWGQKQAEEMLARCK